MLAIKIRKLFAVTFIFVLSAQTLHAASATWNLNPGSGAPLQLSEFTGTGTILVTTTTPTGTPTATPAARFTTLSTRDVVGTGDSVTVNAFIITGSSAKHMIVRGLGPSLPLPSPLQDPFLEFRGPGAFVPIFNNNWRDDPLQEAAIIATGLPPANDLESAIDLTLNAGVYTIVLRGNNSGTGIGLNELYDLNPSAPSRLTAVGTRGSVSTGSNVLISGVMMQEGGPVLLRVLGPSLPVSGRLGDPTLELHDGNGGLTVANDNWRSNQEALIIATGIPPANDLESAIVATLLPGNYTAIVSGTNNTTGIGYVQFYGLPHSGPVLPLVATPTPPVITSPLVATGTVGLGFSYQFQTLFATSLGVTNLPAGLTFSAALSFITGRPTTAGTFQVGLSASNSVGTTNATLTITVQPPPTSGPTIISSTAATGRPGRFFSFQVLTTGGSPQTRVSVTGLPAGLSIDAVTGIISGISAAEGSSAVTLTVTDGTSTTSGVLQLTFTSDPAVPVIISPGSASLAPGEFFSYTITADASGTFGYIGDDGIVHQGPSSAGLPPGLSFDGVATISGIYNPPLFEHDGGRKKWPDLSGGIITNVQLFATGPGGTSIIPLIFFPAATGAVNISTRLAVGTGQDVLIAGFIIQGNAPKKVLIRAIGPSLQVAGALQDTTLELHDGAGGLLGSNDDWRSAPEQEQQIIDTTIPPTDNRESALLAYLSPGSYTAIVRGKDDNTGIAVVEAYDLGTASLDASSRARFANLSTRGTVLSGDNVMIGGFIVRIDTTRVVIRAIGPSLSAFGITGVLPDPTLEVHDGSGSLIFSNDDWRSTQEQDIIATGLAPVDDRESAIVVTLAQGNYTAIVAGKGGATGVALVEAYALKGTSRILPQARPTGPPIKR